MAAALAVAGPAIAFAAGAPAPTPAAVQVAQVDVRGSGPWTALFGASPRRVVVVRVRNNTSAPVAPRLALLVHEGGHSARTIASRQFGAIAPGALRTYHFGVVLPPFPATRFHIEGTVDTVATTVRFTVGTAVVPWGLVGAVAVAFQLVLLRLRNRLRRRLLSARRAEAEERAALLATLRAALAPLLVLESFDPLQYWVTTWDPITRQRWRRAVLFEQTALAVRRGEGPEPLPRGA
jgi:hypothetical protein